MAIVDDIFVQWESVPGAVTYNLYSAPDDASPFTLLVSGLTDTSYVDSAGTLDSVYKVAAVDAYGVEGDLSDFLSAYDPAEICWVKGSIIHPDGTPVDGEPIEVIYYVDSGWIPGARGHAGREGDLPRFAQGNLLTRNEVRFFTDSVGRFEVPIVRLALVMLAIRQTGYQCRFQCPDQATIQLEELASIGEIIQPQEYPF